MERFLQHQGRDDPPFFSHFDRECTSGLFLHSGECKSVCPDGTYPSSSGHCLQCYYMCKTCSGPNDYECTTCHNDAMLMKAPGFEKFCCPQSLLPSVNFATWYYRACIGLIINISLLVGVGICLVAQTRGVKVKCPLTIFGLKNKQSSEKAVYNLTLNYDQSDSDE